MCAQPWPPTKDSSPHPGRALSSMQPRVGEAAAHTHIAAQAPCCSGQPAGRPDVCIDTIVAPRLRAMAQSMCTGLSQGTCWALHPHTLHPPAKAHMGHAQNKIPARKPHIPSSVRHPEHQLNSSRRNTVWCLSQRQVLKHSLLQQQHHATPSSTLAWQEASKTSGNPCHGGGHSPHTRVRKRTADKGPKNRAACASLQHPPNKTVQACTPAPALWPVRQQVGNAACSQQSLRQVVGYLQTKSRRQGGTPTEVALSEKQRQSANAASSTVRSGPGEEGAQCWGTATSLACCAACLLLSPSRAPAEYNDPSPARQECMHLKTTPLPFTECSLQPGCCTRQSKQRCLLHNRLAPSATPIALWQPTRSDTQHIAGNTPLPKQLIPRQLPGVCSWRICISHIIAFMAAALSRGVCRLTCSSLSPTLVPCRAWMDLVADVCSAKFTKPTPLHCPLCGSLSTLTDRMAP